MAFVAAALLLVVFYVFSFRWIHPEFVPFMDRGATKLVAPGKDLIPVSVGGYRVEDNSAIIEDFNGDEAILALPRSFQAEDYPFIKVNLQGFTRFSKSKILWRRADDLSQTHALEFNRSGDEVTQIAMVYGDENYRGKIADIAFLFYDGPALGFENNNNTDILIQSVELRPFSARRVTEQIFEDWSNPPLWDHKSINGVRGVHNYAMLPPNLAINVLCVLSLAQAIAISLLRLPPHAPEKRGRLATLLCILAICWALGECLRWNWRVAQFSDSASRYGTQALEDSTTNSDLRCALKPPDCAEDLLPYF